ncbi:MAG TPA: EF-hand domain-containing protein [Thiobacillus sp.]
MKPEYPLIAALLVAFVAIPSYAVAARHKKPMASFQALDTNKDGYLSMKEFKAKGQDDLAFKAADINGDGRIDPGEYDQYTKSKKSTEPSGESGMGGGMSGQPMPAEPPTSKPPTGY